VLDAAPKKTIAAKVATAVKKVVPTKAAKTTVVLVEPAKPKVTNK
jgi:phenylpyruvate tautomerase PptA (4-oxalocrotonate tautomerase family)